MPGITGLNSALALAAWKSNDDPDFEKLADFVKKTLPPVPISDKPPGEKWKDKTFTAFLAGPEYAELKKRIVHVGEQPFGTLYFGDRLVTATGCRVDTGGWGPEVRSQLMVDEVNKAREEDPECLFAFYKEKAAFTPLEIALLKGKHQLDWVRQFGEKYLVGGRGLKPFDEPAGETRF